MTLYLSIFQFDYGSFLPTFRRDSRFTDLFLRGPVSGFFARNHIPH